MAGYSGTPLVQKLGIKAGHRVLLVGAPDRFSKLLATLPTGVEFVGRRAKQLDVVLLFVPASAKLKKTFSWLAKRLVPNGSLWVCWPKRASGVSTDLDENVIRDHGLAAGLVDVKVCAVDETWSGLKFVIRLADRGDG